MPQPPKDNPRRRNARVGPIDLPAKGRTGRTPAWPLPGPADRDEKAAWVQLWKSPQAHAWEQLGWTRTVARYCRVMVASERPGAPASLLGQVTAMEDRLGLTPKAMRLLLWRIAPDEVAEKRGERRQASAPAAPRLRAVDNTGS